MTHVELTTSQTLHYYERTVVSSPIPAHFPTQFFLCYWACFNWINVHKIQVQAHIKISADYPCHFLDKMIYHWYLMPMVEKVQELLNLTQFKVIRHPWGIQSMRWGEGK